MADQAIAATSGTGVNPSRTPWDQQPGENDLWYARFIRFVALGPKRSVSLVAMGRRNAYPVPAHWPIQAKQRLWRERAAAFDVAAKADQATVTEFNTTIIVGLRDRLVNGEREKLMGVAYQAPPPEDDYEDIPRAVAN